MRMEKLLYAMRILLRRLMHMIKCLGLQPLCVKYMILQPSMLLAVPWKVSMGDQRSPGIIPLAIKDAFSIIQETPSREYLLRLSYLEIYNEAAEVAKTAANSIADLQNKLEDSESSKEDKSEVSDKDQGSEDEEEKKRKAALEKLENASDDTFLGQGLKAIDTSVENFATGAWQAFGNAWKGGSTFVQKLENSIQQGGNTNLLASFKAKCGSFGYE